MRSASLLLGLSLLISLPAHAAESTHGLSVVQEGGSWTAPSDGARALLLGKALVIGHKGTSLRIADGVVAIDEGVALIVAGDSGIAVEWPTGPRTLRNETVLLPLTVVDRDRHRALSALLAAPTRTPRPLTPRAVLAPLPYAASNQGKATVEGLELEAIEVEAGCVEICLE